MKYSSSSAIRSSSSAISSFGLSPVSCEDVVGHLLDQLGPGIVRLVDPVAEAHQPPAAALHLLDERGDVLLVPDLVQHRQHRFVGPAVQRPVERRDARRDGRERVHVGRAHRADRAGGAVLLVVGVEDEQDLERALQHLVRLVPAADAERHVDEVGDVVEIVVREDERQPAGVAEREGRDGGRLGQQPHPLEIAVRRVVDVLGVGIERRERAHHAEQHAHRDGRRSGTPRGTW